MSEHTRAQLLARAYELWSAACWAMRSTRAASEDCEAARTLAFALCDFSRRISGGKTDFGSIVSTASAAVPPVDWSSRPDDYADEVDEAIAVCGGDPRAAIKSLLVMTEFLEREAEGKV